MRLELEETRRTYLTNYTVFYLLQF